MVVRLDRTVNEQPFAVVLDVANTGADIGVGTFNTTGNLIGLAGQKLLRIALQEPPSLLVQVPVHNGNTNSRGQTFQCSGDQSSVRPWTSQTDVQPVPTLGRLENWMRVGNSLSERRHLSSENTVLTVSPLFRHYDCDCDWDC